MAGYSPQPPFPAPPGNHWTGYFTNTGQVGGIGFVGGYVWHWRLDPDNQPAGPAPATGATPAPPPPHLQVSFDTIGQIIPRTIGDVRIALKLIWLQGVNLPYDTLVMSAQTLAGSAHLSVSAVPPWIVVGQFISGPPGIPAGTLIAGKGDTFITMNEVATQDIPQDSVVTVINSETQNRILQANAPVTGTFAGAICAPFDPLEDGAFYALYDGSDLVFSKNDYYQLPENWTTEEAAQLQASLAATSIYPGTESQLPDPLISNDRGVYVTNAFRGLRYIVVPNYPIRGGSIPSLTVHWKRKPPYTPPKQSDIIAVEFAAGAG